MVGMHNQQGNILSLLIQQLRNEYGCDASFGISYQNIHPIADRLDGRFNLPVSTYNSAVQRFCRQPANQRDNGRNGLRLDAGLSCRRHGFCNRERAAYQTIDTAQLCLSQTLNFRSTPRRPAVPRTQESAKGKLAWIPGKYSGGSG